MTWLRRIALGLVALLACLILALSVLLGSEAGSRQLLGWVPGLQVEGFSGRLGGAWKAERLSWDGQLQIDQATFAWRPSCLLRRTLCIDTLDVDRVVLDLAESEPAPDEPFEGLPDLKLPLKLELGRIHVGELQVQGQAIADIELQVRSAGERLLIEKLELALDDMQLRLQGELGTRGRWPLSLQAALNLPAQQEQAWTLLLQAEGELAGRLALQAQSEGYLDATLEGWLEPLDAQVPAELVLRAEPFLATADLPPSLTLEALQLDAAGNLEEGYRLLADGRLAGQQQPVSLSLAGVLLETGLTLDSLRLQAAPERFLEAAGELDWQPALRASLTLQARDFPWQALYPAEVPVELKRLQAAFDYEGETYRGQLQSQLGGPAGDFSLDSRLQGDHGNLAIEELLLQAGPGRITGKATLAFADALAWDAQLDVKDFDPAYWLAEMPGRLAGPVLSSGSQQGEILNWSASATLDGQLRQQPAALALQAAGQGEALYLPIVQVRLGDNRVDGSLSLARELQGTLALRLARLDQLWPELAGSARADLTLAGSRAAPSARLQANAAQLRFQDSRVGSLAAQARLDSDQQLRLNLQADALAQGDTDIGQLTLDASGSEQTHQAQLALDGPLLVADLALDGGMRAGDWRGRLRSARLQAEQMDWQLQAATAIQRFADGRIDLAAHCWQLQQSSASLCAGPQRLAPEPRLDYRLREFPLAKLQPWLGEDMEWVGELDADLRVQLPDAGPRGEIRLEAGAGALRSRQGQEVIELAYQRLSLESQLTPRRIDSRLQFVAGEFGTLALNVALDPRDEALPLQGEFRLDGVQLSAARPFLPMIDRLEGQLDGNGRIDGVLRAPRVEGELRLRDGAVAGQELPMDAEDLQLLARIQGERVELEGDWRSGEHGSGRLQGHLDWSADTEVDLRLVASRLPVRVEPYAQLEAEPDLRVQLMGERLTVSGKIDVPRGEIVIRELPPDTVQVSEDARLVGDDAEREAGLDLAMNVEVNVGSDRLTFSGFGLSADLAGQLRIGDNLDTRGELNLNNGRYRAYGQRLSIRRARVYFAGPIDRPYLDVEAIRRVDTVVAGLRLYGPADRPQSEIFSEPAMAQEQALSYLVLGRPMGNSGEDSNLLGQAALALGLAGSAKVTGGLARLLGVSDFELDTQGSGVTTSVVASGRISERLSLRYGVGVFEPASTLALRYELTRRLYLEAASGLASSLDLFYKRDF